MPPHAPSYHVTMRRPVSSLQLALPLLATSIKTHAVSCRSCKWQGLGVLSWAQPLVNTSTGQVLGRLGHYKWHPMPPSQCGLSSAHYPHASLA